MSDELKLNILPNGKYYARLKYGAYYDCSTFTTEWSDTFEFNVSHAIRADYEFVSVDDAGAVRNEESELNLYFQKISLGIKKQFGVNVVLVQVDGRLIKNSSTYVDFDGYSVVFESLSSMQIKRKIFNDQFGYTLRHESQYVAFDAVNNQYYVGKATYHLVKTSFKARILNVTNQEYLFNVRDLWAQGFADNPLFQYTSNVNVIGWADPTNIRYNTYDTISMYLDEFGECKTVNNVDVEVKSPLQEGPNYYGTQWNGTFAYIKLRQDGTIIVRVVDADGINSMTDPFIAVRFIMSADTVGMENSKYIFNNKVQLSGYWNDVGTWVEFDECESGSIVKGIFCTAIIYL